MSNRNPYPIEPERAAYLRSIRDCAPPALTAELNWLKLHDRFEERAAKRQAAISADQAKRNLIASIAKARGLTYAEVERGQDQAAALERQRAAIADTPRRSEPAPKAFSVVYAGHGNAAAVILPPGASWDAVDAWNDPGEAFGLLDYASTPDAARRGRQGHGSFGCSPMSGGRPVR